MTEATESLRLTQLRASMGIPINVRDRQMALNATKDHLRRQGFRVSEFTQRDLRVRAEAYLEAHRAQLIEDAKADVERWRLTGFFGRRRSNIKTSAKEAKA